MRSPSRWNPSWTVSGGGVGEPFDPDSSSGGQGTNRLSPGVFEHVANSIAGLGENPRPHGSRKLTGREGWRIRVGRYRVIYDIDDVKDTVTVLHVGHRKDVYR